MGTRSELLPCRAALSGLYPEGSSEEEWMRVGVSEGCWGSGRWRLGEQAGAWFPCKKGGLLFPLPHRVSATSPLSPVPSPHAYLSPDGSRCHSLRWRRCRSPRSESRSQESGGTDTAAVSKEGQERQAWAWIPKTGRWGWGSSLLGLGC